MLVSIKEYKKYLSKINFLDVNEDVHVEIIENLSIANSQHLLIIEQIGFESGNNQLLFRLFWDPSSLTLLNNTKMPLSGVSETFLEYSNKIINKLMVSLISDKRLKTFPGSLPYYVEIENLDLTQGVCFKIKISINQQLCELYIQIPNLDFNLKNKDVYENNIANQNLLFNMFENIPIGIINISYDMAVSSNRWIKQRTEKLRISDELYKIEPFIFDAHQYKRSTFKSFVMDPHLLSFINNATISILPTSYGCMVQVVDNDHKWSSKIVDPSFLDSDLTESATTSIDTLTGLLNRSGWSSQANKLFNNATDNDDFYLICYGIDRFKSINDSLGHAAGDWFLQEISRRLRTYYSHGIIGRWSGDEFFVLLEAKPNNDMPEQFKKNYLFDGKEYSLAFSAGAKLFKKKDFKSPDLVIPEVEWALKEAKNQGKNRLRIVETVSSRKLPYHIELALHKSVENNQLHLRYQPLISLKNKKIIGAEVLLRWKHPDEGWIQPTFFIPLAEESGTIIPITEWVIKTACKELHYMLKHDDEFKLSVNLSPLHFNDEDLPFYLTKWLSEVNIPPDKIKLEITEGIVLQNTERNKNTLNSLRKAGFQIAIDDFGTGYAALQYLKDFPVHQVKIDKVFLNDLNKDVSMSLLKSIIQLSKNLNLEVVAEGVETKEQYETLLCLGCDIGQGFYFAKPLDLSDFTNFKNTYNIDNIPIANISSALQAIIMIDDHKS